MRILLVSPLDPLNPGLLKLRWLVGGENTFSRQLLDHPPRGVEYVHFLDALKSGEIRFGFWYEFFRVLLRLRLVPLSPGVLDIKVIKHFDLIHLHVFSARFTGVPSPVVISESSGLDETLRGYFKWPEWRIKITGFVKKLVFKLFNIHDAQICSRKLIVFSDYAKRLNKCKSEVVYPGLFDEYKKKSFSSGVVLVFVGIWFERKGGYQVLRVFRSLKKKYPSLKLIVVGDVPLGVDLSGVEHYRYLPRNKLLNKVFGRGSILLHLPTQEGFGYVILEAMMWGIPVVATGVGAIPELVKHGKTGFVVNSFLDDEVVDAVEKLIADKKLRLKMSRQSRMRFKKYFSNTMANKNWKAIYQESVEGG